MLAGRNELRALASCEQRDVLRVLSCGSFPVRGVLRVRSCERRAPSALLRCGLTHSFRPVVCTARPATRRDGADVPRRPNDPVIGRREGGSCDRRGDDRASGSQDACHAAACVVGASGSGSRFVSRDLLSFHFIRCPPTTKLGEPSTIYDYEVHNTSRGPRRTRRRCFSVFSQPSTPFASSNLEHTIASAAPLVISRPQSSRCHCPNL